MNDFKSKVEDYRHLYFKKFGVKLDDEILYFFIRLNEMQVDIKRDIKAIPKITCKSGWDYFVYGLGNFVNGSIIASILLLIYKILK